MFILDTEQGPLSLCASFTCDWHASHAKLDRSELIETSSRVIQGATLAAAALRDYDGDTLTAQCGGDTLKVRFYCIDTPEMQQQPWSIENRDHLRAITPRVVSLRIHDTDRYGRKVAEVIDPTTGEVLNRAMVAAGYAAVYRRYCPDPSYRQAEASAKAAGLDIWSVPGDHQRPWEWRRR